MEKNEKPKKSRGSSFTPLRVSVMNSCSSFFGNAQRGKKEERRESLNYCAYDVTKAWFKFSLTQILNSYVNFLSVLVVYALDLKCVVKGDKKEVGEGNSRYFFSLTFNTRLFWREWWVNNLEIQVYLMAIFRWDWYNFFFIILRAFYIVQLSSEQSRIMLLQPSFIHFCATIFTC